MTYEQLGQEEDLSVQHAVAQGAHDAVSHGIRYAVLGVLAIAAATVVVGPAHTRKIAKKLTGG